MLKPDALAKLAKLAKLSPEDLTKAITATEEVDLTIDETLVVLSQADLTARDKNKTDEGKRLGVEEGKEAGKEIAAKVFRNKLGIDATTKDIEAIADAAVGKMAGDQSLKEQVTLLQSNLALKDKEIAKLNKASQQAEFERNLIADLPSSKTTKFNNHEHLNLVKMNLTFNEDGTVSMGGKVLRKEGSEDALNRTEAIEHLYKQRGWLDEPGGGSGGGRGGRDEPGGGGSAKNLKEWRQTWQKANPGLNVGSMRYNEDLQKEIKANKDLVMEDDGS
jgi:hypothetical protein